MPGIILKLGFSTYDLCDGLQVTKPQLFNLKNGNNESPYSIELLGGLSIFKYFA